MKKLLLILFSIFFCPALTHSQNITDEGNQWRIAHFDFAQGFLTTPYKLQGDTLINTKIYKKIFSDLGTPNQQLNYLIREDSDKKVFLAEGLSERLIYDFGAEVGDTIISSYNDTIFAMIESVDSIMLLDGSMRKRQKVVSINFLNVLGDEYWIEGIGGGLTAFRDIFELSIIDGDTRLNCFSNNSELLFGPIVGNECDLLASNDNFQSSSFSIFPNPAQNSFFIKNENQENYFIEYELTDFQGITVLKNNASINSKQTIEISTAQFPSGIYFLTLEKNNAFTVKKILIQK